MSQQKSTPALSSLLKQRTASSTRSSTSRRSHGAAAPTSSSKAFFPAEMESDQGGSVYRSTGGDGEGELLSFLSDSKPVATETSGSRGKVKSPTPNKGNYSFGLLILNEDSVKETCGGIISSEKNDYFCCKPTEMCTIKTHKNKHEAFTQNRGFLVRFKISSPGTVEDMRAVSPSKCQFDVEDNEIFGSLAKTIQILSDKIDNCTTESEAISLFKTYMQVILKMQSEFDAKAFAQSDPEYENQVTPIGLSKIATQFDNETDEDNLDAGIMDEMDAKLPQATNAKLIGNTSLSEEQIAKIVSKIVDDTLSSNRKRLLMDVNKCVWKTGPGSNVKAYIDKQKEKGQGNGGCTYSKDNPCPCCEEFRTLVNVLDTKNTALQQQLNQV